MKTVEPLKDTIVIPVIEEELFVGKKEYDAGGVRVTTHVEALPVERTVNIRTERVDVERRAVDRPITEKEEAYRDRAFDLPSYTEEPFITKRARVVEEIRIHKDTTERVERVHDTLRHTDVELSEIPGEPRFDKAFYLAHFQRHYEPLRYSFEWIAPAYRFGEDLGRRMPNVEWTAVEIKAKPLWEEKNPGTWERFCEAIRAGWARLNEKVEKL
jgi:uncharacterized protein (TIGR02271 family)